MGRKLYIRDKKTGEFRGSVSDGKSLPASLSALPTRARAPEQPYPTVIAPKVSLVPLGANMKFEVWVEKNYNRAWAANRKRIIDDFKSYTLSELEERKPDLVKKLNSFAKKFDRKVEEVYKEARRSKLFAETFAIDPKRQNIYEDLAFERINRMKNVSSLIKPPAGGKDSVVIDIATGQLTTRGKLEEIGRGEDDTTRSVDFVWISQGTVFVASHKYIKEAGGGQSHQRDDIAHFLAAAPDDTCYVSPNDILYHEKRTTPMPVVFVGLADGAYYQGKMRNGETRLQKEQRRSNGHNKHVLTMNDLEEFIAEVGRKKMREAAPFN